MSKYREAIELQGAIDMQASFEELTRKINDARGQGGGWPALFEYKIDSNGIILEATGRIGKSAYRCFDSWGVALLHEVRKQYGNESKKLTFNINGNGYTRSTDFEAFLRRVSYLNINNNDIHCEIIFDGQEITLYDEDALFSRPDDEVIRNFINARRDDDKGTLLEKSFQAFLFGKGLGKGTRTNDRMAILGEHFFQSKRKNFGVLREFPTGAFLGSISKTNRITPTEFVDIVTLNRWGYLSIIEIKLDDSKLEVIAQLLDYALYFASYHEKILDVLRSCSDLRPLNDGRIDCYVVNNRFHSRFDDVFRYYAPKNDSYKFRIHKVVLGYTTTACASSA